MERDDSHLEQRSLAIAKWANLCMGGAGVTAALLSNASALMLDGLFSGVNFLAAIFAARVAQSVRRTPDAMRPFGYEIDESVYVVFRSLVLMGIILVAAFNAGNKIFTYVTGGDVPPVKLDWIIGYMALMVAICFFLAVWHHHNWKRTGRRSTLLRTERTGAIIDGVLSFAAGAAFILIAALKGTFLDFLVPISDAIVVLGLAAYMVPQPWRMFRSAMKEVLGEAAPAEIRQRIMKAADEALADQPFALLDAAVTRTGRARFAVVYLRPESAVTAPALDLARQGVLGACRASLPDGPLRMECLFMGEAPLQKPDGKGR